jgi:lipopolysaccharide transport system permease protein
MRYNTTMKSETHHFIELLFVVTERELRARYKNTIFGFFWLVANPLLQMLIIGFVFQFFMKSSIPNYNYFLFLGLLVWNFFSLSLIKTTPSIVFERLLISKASFPREIIPLSIVVSNLVHLIIAMVLFTIPVLFLNTFSIDKILFIFIAYILLVIFTVGISLLTSALNVKYRDVNFFVQALLIIWFYATPIVYTLNVIPYKYVWLWRLNPMTSIMQLFQYAFLNFPMPGPAMLTGNVLIILIISILGISMFRHESKYFDDWV